MHLNVLRASQAELLPLLKLFRKRFYLAGGTAIALHIGHRYSLDFDLFTFENFNTYDLKSSLKRNKFQIQQILSEDRTQLNCLVNGVKITFFQFPFPIEANCTLQNVINTPDLLSLAAMKAFALGGRGKWKDYVDLYYILSQHHTLQDVIQKANGIFESAFSEKLFRQQLAYFEDISFAEEVEFIDSPTEQAKIRAFLSDISIEKA